ncbi:glycosyltransferase [Methyloraptor flagellatus]|uniref:Glycosyltransferase n=1 Tax=Methyloraptor flagellatus TaxID=3162530 RepID=A0AAU7XE61_9HYPH
MGETNSLRIIHFVRAPIGGIFRHIVDLALAQTAEGHRVGIVCDSTTGSDFEAGIIAQVAPKLAFGVTRLPMMRQVTPGDMVAMVRIYRHVARIEPDVIHGHGSKGGTYARLIGTLLRAFGHRTLRIYCPHGGSLHFDKRSGAGRAYLLVERLLEYLTDGLVFVSDFERAAYRTKIGEPTVPHVLAHNGLAPEEFAPVDRVPGAADFMHIGMLRALKGTDVFIRAMAALKERGSTATAIIVGIGEERAAYERMVDDMGLADRVRFLDPMPIRRALSLARAVVVPSRAESLPYVVLETIAADTPLIATRVGGIPEIYGDLTDRLVPPGDVDRLAETMEAFMRRPAQAVVEAEELRRRIRPIFSIETMARTIGAFYESFSPVDITRTRPEAAVANAPPAPAVVRLPARVP